jgi:hypothetical protein
MSSAASSLTPADAGAMDRATGAARRRGPVRTARALWRCRWGFLRLAIGALLLWAVGMDTGRRLALLGLSSLPDFDYAAEVRHLRQSGRYGEAIVIADAGLASTTGEVHARIERERDVTVRERASFLRRLRDAGAGALTGSPSDPEGVADASLERLAGAIAADLFIVGDIRDILLQGGHLLIDGETDEVVLLLSTVGLVTTLAPEVDWVPSLLKIVKKTGRMTKGLSDFLAAAIKGRKTRELRRLLEDVRVLADKASPAGAIRLLGHVDDPADAAKLARFVERNGGGVGAFTLHVAGKEGVDMVKAGANLAPEAAKASEAVLIAAAKKGAPGVAWLKAGGAKRLLRPHPLVGIAKGLWKGNVQMAVQRALDRMGRAAWWLVPLLGAWVVVEIGLIGRRLLLAGAQQAVCRGR